MLIRLYLILIISFSIVVSNFSQATYTANLIGSWDIPLGSLGSCWSAISGTDSDADGLPDSDDDVVINSTVAMPNASLNVKAILINVGGEIQLAGSSRKIYLYGPSSYLTNNGTISGTGTFEIYSNGTVFSGSGTWSNNIYIRATNSVVFDNVNLTFDVPFLLRIGGDATINSNSTITFNSKVYSSSYASLMYNYGTININSNDFFRPPYQTADVVFYNYPSSNVNYGASSGSSGDFPRPFTGYYDLEISGTADCDGDFTIYENWVNSGNFTSSNSGNNITFGGSSTQIISGAGTNNFKKITLNNSSGLTLSSGTINISEVMESSSGTFTQNGSSLVLASSSSNNAGLIKVNNSTDYNYSSGSFTVERYYNGTSNGWRMVGSPISPSTLADWDDEFIYCGISAGIGNFTSSACAGFYSVYKYDETSASPSIDDGLVAITDLNESVSNGVGTLIYTSLGATTVSVTGNPNFSSFNKAITRSNDGWNLVSNPYPSTIDWTNGSTGFYDDNSSIIESARWIYKADNLQYESKTISDGSTADIGHSQGFWVKATSAGNLSYNVSQTNNSQPTFVKSTNGINKPLTLNLTNDFNLLYDLAYVIAGSDYTNNYDSHEVSKLFSPYPDDVANIYFLDNQGNELDRNCINNNQSDQLFFDVRVGNNVQGNYTINFDNLSQFMIGSCIILEDIHNGIITDLRLDSSYTFVSDSTSPSPRFKLNVDVNYDINVKNSTCFQNNSASVTLTGSSISGSYFNLINENGVIVDSILASQDTILFNGLNAGNYTFLTNHSGSCSMSNQEVIIIEPEAVIANFTTLFDTVFIDTSAIVNVPFKNLSSGATSYNWNFGDGNFSTQVNPTNTYSSSGLYTVQLTADNDSIGLCSNIKYHQIYVSNQNFSNNITDSFKLNEFYISNNKLIFIDILQEEFICNIYDINGKNIKRDYLSYGDKHLDLSSLKKGIYFAQLISSKSFNLNAVKFIIN
jgi:PKD repeat protein